MSEHKEATLSVAPMEAKKKLSVIGYVSIVLGGRDIAILLTGL
jgi:hypothetical protein